MPTFPERHLKTGGDPRTLADYVALRDEINKLTHPARPDVDWIYIEKRCLSLFEHNGVELQTAAWYTLARTHNAGLSGMNEGLTVLMALVSWQWEHLWPHPANARVEILSTLSKRLQQGMRTLTLTYTDLSQMYQGEAHLKALEEVLQRRELNHGGHLTALRTLLHNAVIRLEKSDGATGAVYPSPVAEPGDVEPPARDSKPTDPVKRVYVVQPEPQPHIEYARAPSQAAKWWRPFIAGMLTMLVMAGGTVGGWQAMHQPDPLQAQLAASLAPLPVALAPAQLKTLPQSLLLPERGISQTKQQLARLGQLEPDWAFSYSLQLVQQALTLWPEQAKPLATQWQQQVAAQALPTSGLNGWYQGMTGLQNLANQLNALDEKRGKYMTVSELKTQVFAIMQSFNRAIPAEEQLRQLSVLPEGEPWPAAQQSLTEQHLQQLIARYGLLKQAMPE